MRYLTAATYLSSGIPLYIGVTKSVRCSLGRLISSPTPRCRLVQPHERAARFVGRGPPVPYGCNLGCLLLLITCRPFPLYYIFWTFVGSDVLRVLFSPHQIHPLSSVIVRHRPPSVGYESSLPLFFFFRRHGTPSWDPGSTLPICDKNKIKTSPPTDTSDSGSPIRCLYSLPQNLRNSASIGEH